MKMNMKKKGFTITELVIVIAVIAVLAAVLIPTFVSLVRKANESKDIQLVHNLNTALTVDGGEHKTMQDALDAAFESGYDVGKINASATGNEILWDSKNDKFCYLKDNEIKYIPETQLEGEAKNTELWRISDKKEDLTGKYSIYYTGTESTIETTVGFDAGKNATITSVTYNRNTATDAQNVIIRTNGGKLTVDAPKDTVYHYGEVENVNITAVDMSSYHENGTAGYIEIKQGHFVAESNSTIYTLLSTGSNEQVKLDANQNADVKVAYTTNEAANGTAHGGNLKVEYKIMSDIEKNELIYHAEAQVANEVAVNGIYYKSINDAFDKAPKDNGDGFMLSGDSTIVLLKDIEGPGLFISDNNNGGDVVIDFNDHTYTVNGAVGSSTTATQAMHFGKSKTAKPTNVTMKNGSLVVKSGNKNIKMAMQNYSPFTAENMSFDFTNITVTHYGNNFTGDNAKYNGLEAPMFNNNGTQMMVLTNCTIKMPSDSKKGLSGNITLNNTKIHGYICVMSSEDTVLVDSKSTVNEVVPYFAADDDKIKTDTTSNTGYTKYFIAE